MTNLENSQLTVLDLLAEIQAHLNAPKNQFNKFGNFHYRSKEDILEGLKDFRNKYAFSVYVNDEIVLIGNRYYVKSTATLKFNGGEASAVSWAREPESKKGMDDSQLTGSAASYSGKRALGNLFAIDDSKDADYQSQAPNNQPQQQFNPNYYPHDSAFAPSPNQQQGWS